MSAFTVIADEAGIHIVEGDCSQEPELQGQNHGGRRWVAVAVDQQVAERWGQHYLEYLTDSPVRVRHHFSALLAMAGAAVPRMCIPARNGTPADP